ncbi:MAG: S41 family peptidase [Candidatus Omnitrophota bacterium]|nr:S41 family peptidase [Candidatus Omnitrophota bacterium]
MRKKVFAVFFILVFGLLCFSSYIQGVEEKKDRDDVYNQLDIFADVFTYIKNDYAEEIQNKDLVYGALKGMLSSLDAHSQFLDPETYNELKVDTQGKFGGLGIEITLKDGLITVVTPIEDTPAWKAGIKSQDRIVKINNEVTRNFSLTDAVKKMRGKPGTEVTITVLREKESKLLDFTIKRDIIKIKDIKEARILEDGIAYIRLSEFREDTKSELAKTLENLKKEKMQALIIDLRNNPGGLLTVAVDVSEKFIEKNKIVVWTQGRDAKNKIEFKSKDNSPILDIPIVVLINEGSASGSEILAGCLQDYKRALLVGTKSFGKGSVQTLIPLSDGSAIKLTTSKYFTPSGRSIHNSGIVPDVTIEQIDIPGAPGELEKKKEEAVITDEVFEKIDSEPKGEPKKDETYKKDFQIVSAVSILKGILAYGQAKK